MTRNTPVNLAKRLMQAPYRQQPNGWTNWENVQDAFHELTDEALREYAGEFHWKEERGIVIVGGGRYFDSTYVTVRVLRHLGCTLPIEIWHLEGEIDDEQHSLLMPFDISFRNAEHDPQTQSFRFLADHWWRGWQLKSCALRYCSFREVLLLDSDCYPVRNPEYLFDWSQFQEWGAVFWPDLDMNRGLIKEDAWRAFEVKPFKELPTESGQILINREICQRELHLACHFNQHADFVYNVLYGDKDTFPIAWQRLGRQYARMWPSSQFDSVVIKQFDFNGQIAFLHRVHDKFRCNGTSFDGTPQQYHQNQFHENFPLEAYCFSVLDELKASRLVATSSSPSIEFTSPNSIEEMYPPVDVKELITDDSQQDFERLFIDSGVFADDPFEVCDAICRPHENCISASLFKQNPNNRRRNEFEVDDVQWTQKYWQRLERLTDELWQFPGWKLRLHVENQLWDRVVARFSNTPQVELFRMNTDSIGASPGTLWRFMALSDSQLQSVLVSDIDEPLIHKKCRIESFERTPNASLGRLGGFTNPQDYLVDKTSGLVKNYATIIASCILARPEQFNFDMADALKGFMVRRLKATRSDRPWAYSDDEKLSTYNCQIGNHLFGWGSHWAMYCFDERFLKHVLYYHFAKQGTLLTWASSLRPDIMSTEGLCDFRYVTEHGNPCIL